MDCSFGNLVKFVFAVTPKILARSPKLWKHLLLLKICRSESSAGYLECIPDETGVFLQLNLFLRGTIRRYKIVPSSKETFFKKFYWSRGFQFWDPCRKALPKTGICSFQINKQSQTYVFSEKETFSLNVFLSTHGMQFWHLWRFCFTRNPKHSRSEPKILKSFGSSRKV